MECPIKLKEPICEFCIYSILSDDDYEYRCNHNKIKMEKKNKFKEYLEKNKKFIKKLAKK
jgi:lipopolysaccharide biosynthesis glycosyltransferase